MRNKNYHFSGVIANNERVIYEPFDSNLIVWIGVDFALKMYFRSIQNWWISQLWRWWRIKIAFNGSHIAVNVKFDFRRVLNLLEKKIEEKKTWIKKSILLNGILDFEMRQRRITTTMMTTTWEKRIAHLSLFDLCTKHLEKKIMLNHNRLVSKYTHKSHKCSTTLELSCNEARNQTCK